MRMHHNGPHPEKPRSRWYPGKSISRHETYTIIDGWHEEDKEPYFDPDDSDTLPGDREQCQSS